MVVGRVSVEVGLILSDSFVVVDISEVVGEVVVSSVNEKVVELVELVVDVAVEVEDIVVLMGSGEIPKHWHSEQYNVLIFSVQQSPPSN